jgi:hypothetical protein
MQAKTNRLSEMSEMNLRVSQEANRTRDITNAETEIINNKMVYNNINKQSF